MEKKIEIIYLTEDSTIKSLCAKYWDTNGVSLTHKTQKLIKEYRKHFPALDSYKLNEIVNKNSIAYFEGTELCNRCKFPYQKLLWRYPLRNQEGKEIDGKKYCNKCYEKLLAERQRQWEQEQDEIRQKKEELMRSAFQNKIYEQLTLTENKFLYHLSHSENSTIASSKSKLDDLTSKSIIDKLNQLHIINWHNGIEGYSILPELISTIDELIKSNKISEMQAAINEGIHKTALKTLEFNFLISFAEAIKKYDDYKERIIAASKPYGLDFNIGENIFKKLVELNLVNNEIENCSIILPDFARSIQNKFTQKTKSIWKNTYIEKGIYKLLKKEIKNYFIFPQVPYSAFTETKNIEHLFAEFKSSFNRNTPFNYYLQCRTDFLLTDKQGNPKVVIEYQGGGHQEEDIKIKDEFKKKILQECGIPFHFIDKKSKSKAFEDIRVIAADYKKKIKSLSQREIDKEVKENTFPKTIGYYERSTISLYRNTDGGFFVMHKRNVYSLPFKKEREINYQTVVEIIQTEEKIKWRKKYDRKRTAVEFEKSGIKIMYEDNGASYITNGNRIVPVPNYRHPKEMSEEECLELLSIPENELMYFIQKKRMIKEFKEHNIQILYGPYGPFITDEEINAGVPKNVNASDLTVEQCLDILKAKKDRQKSTL